MRLAWIVVALAAVALGACDTGEPSGGDGQGDDAAVPYTQVFNVQQPAEPGLQQLINTCASGFDQASCDAMCLRVICGRFMVANVMVSACSLRRSGPIATITVTYNGPITCPPPPPIPTDLVDR